MDCEPVLYRGIDFVLRTKKPVQALEIELAKHIHDNRVSKGVRTIVASSPTSKRGVESEINSFCDLIEKLSPRGMQCWKACISRVFDIGIDSGSVAESDPFKPLELQVAPSTLKRTSSLNAQLAITVYPQRIDSVSARAALPPKR